MLASLLLIFALVVPFVYWTTGAAQRVLGGGVAAASLVSLGVWWSADCVLAFVIAPRLGPTAQLDLVDLGFEPSALGKLAFYAAAHALAVLPRLLGRSAHA